MFRSLAEAGAAAFVLGLLATAHAQAPAYQAPKTPWGAPDLQGVWTNASVTKLTRPPGIDRLVLTPEQAAEIERKDFNNARTAIEKLPTDQTSGAPVKGKPLPQIGNYNAVWVDPGSRLGVVRGEFRSSWITDPPSGQTPMSEAGRRKLATWRPAPNIELGAIVSSPRVAARTAKAGKRGPTQKTSSTSTESAKPFVDIVEAPAARPGGQAASMYAGPESRGTGERCLVMGNSGGPVMLNGLYNNNFQIVQSPGHVLIDIEMIHDARIIPIATSAEEARARHMPAVMERWLGDSVGWYEGETLVIESRNFNRWQAGQVFISDTGVLTERLTRVGPEDILYEFSVTDPEVYTQTWKGEIPWRKNPDEIYEYACHEGNYGLLNILKGAREMERDGRALEVTATEE